MRVGVLGGAFNPMHVAHIYIAQQAMKAAKLDVVWFVPSGGHPQKPALLSAVRMDIIREHMKLDRRFYLNTYEVLNKGVSYTLDTLEFFQRTHKSWEFVLIIGADQAENFNTWRGYERILERFEVVVVAREGYFLPVYLEEKVNLVTPEFMLDISSSLIRESIIAEDGNREHRRIE